MVTHAIIIADRDGVIGAWNRGAEILFGHPAADAIGRTLDLVVPQEMRDRHWRGFRTALASGEARISGVTAPVRVLRSGGDIVEVTGVLNLLRGPHDAVIGAIAVYEVPEDEAEGRREAR